MKTKKIDLVRYDADEGKVFDWVEPHSNDVPNDLEHPEQGTHQEQNHLYAKVLFIGAHDSIENYVEVDEPITEE